MNEGEILTEDVVRSEVDKAISRLQTLRREVSGDIEFIRQLERMPVFFSDLALRVDQQLDDSFLYEGLEG